MSHGYPYMTALLGLLAVAGIQNRDKLAEMLGGLGSSNPGIPGQGNRQQHGGLIGLFNSLSSGGLGSLLGGRLGELVENFEQEGHGEVADSWVRHGPNQQIAPCQLEQAIGPDVVDTLSQ